MLTIVALLAFANAAHDSLVFDDKAFIGPDATHTIDTLSDAFTQDVWQSPSHGGALYRPLLLIVMELQNRSFGDWLRGYHLVNIALHLGATLLLLGFLRHLLARSGADGKMGELAALLAALVFAVHPIHTEVVNSVFNGSDIYVSICSIAGLWWLFSRLDTRPASAWLGLAVAYSIAILFKESALVLPGIAVALIVILTPGSAVERVRRFLPVFWLLIPVAVYLWMRAAAIAPDGYEPTADASDFSMMLMASRLPEQETLLAVVGMMGQGIRAMAWPWPLQLFYADPQGIHLAILIAGQALLAIAAIILLFRGKPSLAAGLAFFYIAMLPASRLISMDGAFPALADRYLYVPSIGLAIVLAFALHALSRRYGARLVVALGMPVILLLAAVTWDRNYDWSSELVLFETQYQEGHQNLHTLRILLAHLNNNGRFGRAAEICDEKAAHWPEHGVFTIPCANAYIKMNRTEEAIQALEVSTGREETAHDAHLLLGNLLIDLGRKQEGADHFVHIINSLENPARKEMFKGLLMIKLYPNSQSKLEEARAYFEKALTLEPELESVQDWLDHLDSKLNGDNTDPPPEE